MENKSLDTNTKENIQEVKIGKVVYRLTSVFIGENELNKTLEKLAVKKVLNDILIK